MKLRTLTLASAILAALGSPAWAGEGFYLGLQAGIGFPNSPTGFVSGTGSGHGDFENAGVFGGSMGYKFPMGIRAELETTFSSYDANRVVANGTTFGVTSNSDIALTTWMGNVAYDFRLMDQLLLTAGGGIGAMRVTPDVNIPGVARFGHGDTTFGWQLMAGVIYEVSPSFDLQVDYRYRSATSSDGHTLGFGTVTKATLGDFNTQAVIKKIKMNKE